MEDSPFEQEDEPMTEDEEIRGLVLTLRHFTRLTHTGFLVYADSLCRFYPELSEHIATIRAATNNISMLLDAIEKEWKQ